MPPLRRDAKTKAFQEDVDAWHAHVRASGVRERYGVRMGDIETQPWGMRDFVLFDPSGVLWRIAQNID